MTKSEEGLRRVVVIVAVLNLAYFGIEFSMAEIIGSVSLLADSIDFLEILDEFSHCRRTGLDNGSSRNCGEDASGLPVDSRSGHALDGMAEIFSSRPT